MSEPWGEDVLKARIASLLERAERAERKVRELELEYGSRMRKRANRRGELRRMHKAVQRYSAMYREQVLRSAHALEIERVSRAGWAKRVDDEMYCLRFELQKARVRIAELERR